MLQIDIQQVLSQAITFLILFWALKKFAWGPMLDVIDARRERIEKDLGDAESAKAEMEQLREDLDKRLAHIEDEARERIQQAIQEGRRVASEIQDEARNQSQALLVKSKESVEMELAKAKVTLRNQLADMTVEAVERVLREKLDKDTDAELIDKVIDDIERKAARR